MISVLDGVSIDAVLWRQVSVEHRITPEGGVIVPDCDDPDLPGSIEDGVLVQEVTITIRRVIG